MRIGAAVAMAVMLTVSAFTPSAAATATGEPGTGCPGESLVACPRVTTEVASVTVARRAILVGVEVSSRALVQVFGQVSWQVRQPDGSNRGLTQGVSAGAPRPVTSVGPTIFRVPLGKAVSRRLARITPRQSLRAQMTVRTTDLAGRENDRGFRVRLHGRKR